MLVGDQSLMLESDAAELLKAYHIPYPDHALARNADEATRIADNLEYPVVLKIVSSEVVHKSDVGGVQANLTNAESVKKAFQQILDHILLNAPYAQTKGVLVCQQAPPGLEVIVGALKDLTFGPVIMFGLGGVFTEILKDVSFRLAPLLRKDAEDMIHEIRGYPLLTGIRGRAVCDTQALVDLLLNLSQLVMAHPEIDELDLNPVRVYERGLMALDVRLISKLRKD
jgi:acyl-CoA synthetase (NDP forming)